jgi:hypothetical protein
MVTTKRIFSERVQEIEEYSSFIENFIANNNNESINKILKANLLLMLYNLVESTMSNAIEEIHNSIDTSSVSFNDLRREFKTVLIGYLKKHLNPNDFVTSINDISKDIIKKCFVKQKLFNGNIDSRKIKEISSEYGFSCTTNYNRTKHGKCLVDIKGKRNDLAHGIFSFTEVGKDYSTDDLKKMKEETVNYLDEILNNIKTYIANREYIGVISSAV